MLNRACHEQRRLRSLLHSLCPINGFESFSLPRPCDEPWPRLVIGPDVSIRLDTRPGSLWNAGTPNPRSKYHSHYFVEDHPHITSCRIVPKVTLVSTPARGSSSKNQGFPSVEPDDLLLTPGSLERMLKALSFTPQSLRREESQSIPFLVNLCVNPFLDLRTAVQLIESAGPQRHLVFPSSLVLLDAFAKVNT